MKNSLYLFLFILIIFAACDKDNTTPEPPEPPETVDSSDYNMIFKYKFDATQQRLDNFGNPAVLPSGHAAQTPNFHTMGVHYIELSKENDIPAYNGTQLYKSIETTEGGDAAIDFDEALYGSDGEDFFSVNLGAIPAGTYKYLRMSLSYQNYDIDYKAQGFNLVGTIASFLGSNTYIRNFIIKNETVNVNENRLQGYWAFEAGFPSVPVIEGQAPAGATTVPNPIAGTSAIPFGSCLVTGVFDPPLVITGNEAADINISASLSINNSFEWIDGNGNGIYEPADGELVVDMGVRGLVPMVE